MKLYFFFIALFLSFSTHVVAQKVIKHKVKSGESIYAIAKKYDVTETEIFDLNPKLKGAVLALNAEVKIPNKKFKPEEKKLKEDKKDPVAFEGSTENTHLVEPKETLYSISKMYNVTVESICLMNPKLKPESLKSGMRLRLPFAAVVPDVPVKTKEPKEALAESEPIKSKKPDAIQKKTEEVIVGAAEMRLPQSGSNVDVVHTVQPKETLYRISKKYNVSIEELKKLNPEVASGLPVGYDLIVKKGFEDKTVKVATPNAEPEIAKSIEYKPLSPENLSKADFLIAKASENLGTRYRSGGTTSAGFDCSGLMFSTFKNIDMTLPRSSYDMAKYGQKIDRSQAQKGDLIFFATFGGGRVSHVGMVTEVLDDEIKFIHSSTQSGVIISSTKENYYSRTFVQVNRVLLQ